MILREQDGQVQSRSWIGRTILAGIVFQILLAAPGIAAAEKAAKKEAGGNCQLQATFVETAHPAERDRKSLELARKRLQMAKDPLETFHAQVHFARMANNVQQLADAKPIAETILKTAPKFKKNWDYGNGVHIAHIVLGRYAASTGDVATAKYHLNAAAFPEASSILREFGPNLSLARDLLKRGECHSVLAFLSKYAKIWRTEDAPQKFSEWEKDIKSGKFPRFGANLVY